MDSAEIKTPFKLAMESFPGVIFRNRMEIEEDLKDCKLAVVGILGDDKSGKSSLMNLMLKYLQREETGFQGWTSDLIEKWMTADEGFYTSKILSRQGNNILDFNEDGGLYTWPQPFILRNPGEDDTSDKVAVLFLDLNMTLMTPTMQLLMCLLCSTLIYNTKSIDVSHFCRLIKTIRKSTLQFLSEGELYKCTDLLFKQLTIVFRDHRETATVKNGEDKSLSYLSKILNLKENREISDVIKDIANTRCFLLPKPKQEGPITDKKYVYTDSDFCKHLRNLITQTATVKKLVLKYCNGIAMTGKTFFSTFEAICNIAVFPLSQDFNELLSHDVPPDKREDIKGLKSVAKQNYPAKKSTIQANATENVISKGNLKNIVPEINKKDSTLTNATAEHKFHSTVELQISDKMKFYNDSMTEILSAIFPLPFEILLEEHNQIIENFTREISSFYNDDVQSTASADIMSQLIPQLEEAYKIYQKRVEKDFAYYQHAENTQIYFEKLFIQEYKKGLISGSFFQFKVEKIFEDLMKKSIHEYILKSPGVCQEELLKTIYKLPDTQKCFKKIKNVQLSLQQYLVDMNTQLKEYNFFSAVQLNTIHAHSTKKAFQLCQAEKTKKILDLGLYILIDKYEKINAEILRCEEDAFKNIIIPKVEKFYIVEMKMFTQKKLTSSTLTAAHEKLKQECNEVVRKACSFQDANIPLLKTSFKKLDKVLDSGLKNYIQANQIKIENVHVKVQAAIRDALVQYNEAMVKKIENKTFSVIDLTSLHKKCLNGVADFLKVQICSIDDTEDPTRHIQSLNVQTQNYFDSFMQENETRIKIEAEKQKAERVEPKKQETEETIQRNTEEKVCSSNATTTNGTPDCPDTQSNIIMNPEIPLQSIEETTQIATSSLNTASVQILHKIEKKIKQNLSDSSKRSPNQIIQKIEKGKLQSAEETTVNNNEESVKDYLRKNVKFEQVVLKTPEDRIKYYKSCMTELLSSTFPLPAEKLLEKHNNLLTLFLIEDLINEDTASTNVFQNLFSQLSEIYQGYVTRVENDLINCQHVEKVQEIFEKSFMEVFIDRLRSCSFLDTEAWKILNDLMERAVGEYAAESPGVSKEDILNIIKRLPATQKCVAEIVELQTVLKQYIFEMNKNIEINNFFSAEQLNEFHSAAKAKTVPLLEAEYQIRIAELGIRILKERYDGIVSKINHLESLIDSKVTAVRSTVTPSCPYNEIISRLGEIYHTVKSELTSFCETISVIEPGCLFKLMYSRIKQKMSDDVKQFAENSFIDETTNKILLNIPTLTIPAVENSANSKSSKKSEKNCSTELQLQIEKRMKYYHETIAELFSSNYPPKQETLFAKHNQVFNDVIKQMSSFCSKENILLTDALKMIIPQLEEAYKLYQTRMENCFKFFPYFILVQNLFEVTFCKLFQKYLRCGLFLTDNVQQIVKIVVEIIIEDPFDRQLPPISKKTIIDEFYKRPYSQKCFIKVETLQKAMKLYLKEMNSHFEVHNFFSVKQLQRFHADTTQNVLKAYKTKEIRESLFDDGFIILKQQYDRLNEEIVSNELNIFKTITIPKIKEFYDQEMKILTLKPLTAIEIIESDATIRQECKQVIQKACSFHETNISTLENLFEKLDSDLLSRMHFYIQSNNTKILSMQENIKKIVDEAHSEYKDSMSKRQEKQTLNYIELVNLHKESLQKADKYLRQAMGDEFHANDNPFVPIQPVHLLRCNIEQDFVRILKQSYSKNVEDKNEIEIPETTDSSKVPENEISSGSQSLEMKPLNIEGKKPTEKPEPEVTSEQNVPSNESKTEEVNEEPEPIVAIEFGFKKIKCGLIRAGKFTLIPNKSGEMEFLNHVAFTPKGEVLVGWKYLDRPLNIKIDYNPGQLMVASPNELDILPLIPFQETAILPKKEFLAGLILSKVKADAESFLNQTVNSVVITVPLSYGSSQRQAMRDAAIIAGFNSVHLINDITAAAMAYANYPSRMNHKTKNLNFLIVNATCSNVDVAVFEFSNGNVTIKSCGGNHHGGLRGKLYYPNCSSLKERQTYSLRNEKAAVRRLLQHCTNDIDVAEYAVIFDGSKGDLFREKLCDVGKNAFKPKSSDAILMGAAHFAELLKCNEQSAKSAGRDLFPYSLKCIQPHSKTTTMFNRYLPLPLMDTIHTLNFETSCDFVVEVLEIGNNLVAPSKSGFLQVFVKSMCGQKKKGKISIRINSEGILQFKANYIDNEESIDLKWNSFNLTEEDIAIFASLVKSSLVTKK